MRTLMRNARLRLGVQPSSFYLACFDETKLRPDGADPSTAYVTIGEGDQAFDVHVPLEFGALRADLIPMLRSVLSNIVEMDDCVRAANPDDDEELVEIVVREFFVELRYRPTPYNGERTEYFTFTDGHWRRRGWALPWMVDWPVRAPGQVMALDVAYADTHAAAAGVYFPDWDADAATGEFSWRSEAAPNAYASGEFYKRELPVLMALLDQSPVSASTLIVDGYVWLSADGRPGLGARLYEALAWRVPVIGVAKTKFGDDVWSQPIRRGASDAPLFVTAVGMDRTDAARCIERMSGGGRVPRLLSRADRLARSAVGGYASPE